MQDRTRSRTRPADAIEQDEVLTDGFVARLADQVFDNPAMSGGLFVMALTAAAIVSNAMMMQNGRHPDPFFMTRPTPAAQAPVPLPRVRIEAVPRAPAPVPLPRVPPAPAAPPVSAADPRLVAEVQHALAVKKLYAGAADGIAGSRTRAAITAYEKSAGLPVTGLATADLLARLNAPARQAAAKPAATKSAAPVAVAAATPSPPPAARLPHPPAAPAAPPVTVVAEGPLPAPPAEREAVEPIPALAMPEPAEVAIEPAAPAARPPARVALAPAAEEPAPPPAAAAPPVAEAPIPSPGPDPALIERQRYRSIQNALNQAGYGPLPIDGVAGDETANAIRRFELDNGLPLTGRPSDRVAARLIAIGAMPAN